MYLILMVYACLISCSLINKSKCHSLAYFNLRWTCVVILHKCSLKTIYYSQYLICVSCCCEVWGNTYKTNIDFIYLLQKQLARIVSNVHCWHHTNGLTCELHILKLSHFLKLKTPIIMSEANKKLLPNNLLLFFNSL